MLDFVSRRMLATAVTTPSGHGVLSCCGESVARTCIQTRLGSTAITCSRVTSNCSMTSSMLRSARFSITEGTGRRVFEGPGCRRDRDRIGMGPIPLLRGRPPLWGRNLWKKAIAGKQRVSTVAPLVQRVLGPGARWHGVDVHCKNLTCDATCQRVRGRSNLWAPTMSIWNAPRRVPPRVICETTGIVGYESRFATERVRRGLQTRRQEGGN